MKGKCSKVPDICLTDEEKKTENPSNRGFTRQEIDTGPAG